MEENRDNDIIDEVQAEQLDIAQNSDANPDELHGLRQNFSKMSENVVNNGKNNSERYPCANLKSDPPLFLEALRQTLKLPPGAVLTRADIKKIDSNSLTKGKITLPHPQALSGKQYSSFTYQTLFAKAGHVGPSKLSALRLRKHAAEILGFDDLIPEIDQEIKAEEANRKEKAAQAGIVEKYPLENLKNNPQLFLEALRQTLKLPPGAVLTRADLKKIDANSLTKGRITLPHPQAEFGKQYSFLIYETLLSHVGQAGHSKLSALRLRKYAAEILGFTDLIPEIDQEIKAEEANHQEKAAKAGIVENYPCENLKSDPTMFLEALRQVLKLPPGAVLTRADLQNIDANMMTKGKITLPHPQADAGKQYSFFVYETLLKHAGQAGSSKLSALRLRKHAAEILGFTDLFPEIDAQIAAINNGKQREKDFQEFKKQLNEDPEYSQHCLEVATLLGEDIAREFELAKRPNLNKDPVIVHQVNLRLNNFFRQQTIQIPTGQIPDIEILPEDLFIRVPDSREILIDMLRDQCQDRMMLCENNTDKDALFLSEERVIEELKNKMNNSKNAFYKSIWKDVEKFFEEVHGINNLDVFVDHISPDKQCPTLQQRIILVELKRKKRFLNAEKPGRAKTFTAIFAKHWLDEIEGQQNPEFQPQPGLIICPKKMIPDWEKRLCGPKLTEDGRTACVFKQERKPQVAILDSERWQQQLPKINNSDWVLVNIEMLTDELVEKLMNCKLGFVNTDECHNMRNPQGRWTRLLMELSLQHPTLQDGYQLFSSATPIPDNVKRDLPPLLKMLQPDKHGDTKKIGRQLSRSNGGMIRRTLRRNMFRSNLNHLDNDLPALHDPMIKRDREAIYMEPQKIEQDGLELIAIDENKGALQMIDGMRRILLSRQFLGANDGDMGPKYQALKNRLLEVLSVVKTAVVVEPRFNEGVTGNFNKALLANEDNIHLFEALKTDPDFAGVNFYRIDGTKRPDEPSRAEVISQLHSANGSEQQNILLTTAPSFGEGIDGTFAHYMAHLGPYWNLSRYEQTVSRLHRPGQTHEVTSDIFLARGTIEEAMFERCFVKGRLIESVIENGRQISDEEWQDIAENFSVSRRSYLNLLLQPEAKQLKEILDSMLYKGPETIQEFLGRYNGNYARRFVELWDRWFDRMYAGDNWRYLANVHLPALQAAGLLEGNKLADLGCGLMQIARSFPDKDVFSIDINPFATPAGRKKAEALGINIRDDQLQTGSFDKINLPDGDRDTAICSLAFDFTNNNQRKYQDIADVNRVATLCEFNRILKEGGILIMLLTKNRLRGEQFKLFCQEMTNFGFELLYEHTGYGYSFDNDAEQPNFQNVVITLRKIGQPNHKKITRTNLNFSQRPRKKVTMEPGKKDLPPPQTKPSVYQHNVFGLQHLPKPNEIQIPEAPVAIIDQSNESTDELAANGNEVGTEIGHICIKIEKILRKGSINDVMEITRWLRLELGMKVKILSMGEQAHFNINPGKTQQDADNIFYFRTPDGKKIYRVEST